MIKNSLNLFMEKALYNYDLPSLAIGISIGETSKNMHAGLEYTNAVGFEDFLTKRAVKESSIFHMASVTKLFVGTSIMQLWEKGLIDLNAKITDYLPWFQMADHRFQEITVKQLLSHTSGMPDVEDYCWNHPEMDEGALERYVRSKEVQEAYLLWTPGDRRFAYSNIAYEILGVIIATISKMPFEEYVKQNIFIPLEMKDSTLLTFERCMTKENVGGSLNISKLGEVSVCTPHTKDEEKHIVRQEYFPYNRAHGPSSTLTSNVIDLGKWAKANIRKEILKPETYEQMWKEEGLIPNNGEHICLSWFKRTQKDYILYGHEGTDDGFRASFWICPELESHIVVASNLSNAPVKKISKQIFDLLT